MDATRQYGSIDQIRADHTKRYLFAAQKVKGTVLDLACGCGYGAWILHKAGNQVVAIDIEPEAIAYAKEHYAGPEYRCEGAEEPQGHFDAIVAFEVLEHLDRPEDALNAQAAPLLIASVPNEEFYPFKAEKFAEDKYPHKRHYTPAEFEALLTRCGWTVTEWYCQKDKQGEIHSCTDGMFLIAIGRR